MKKLQRRSIIVINLLLLVCLIAIWVALAPVQIGGQAIYVMVSGNSMAPVLGIGDLAIVRVASSYQVGEIVTYYDAQVQAKVIHRIIGIQQDRFILKGDNNSWVDAYNPNRDEIIGKLWILLPRFGKVFQWLRLPWNMALTAGLLGGVLMAGTLFQPPQRGKNVPKRPTVIKGGLFEGAVLVLGFLAFLFLISGIFAFTRPVLKNADNIPYQQTGVFFYSAAGMPGVYDTDTVRSGEPVFLKLTCMLNLGFVYNLAGVQLENASGYQQLSAKVTDEQSGWQRTISLGSVTTFTGNSSTIMASLDLCQVESLVAAVEQETGFHPNTYTLTIAAHVSVGGNLMGQGFNDVFDPELVFKFDSLHFYLAPNDTLAGPLQSSKTGSLSNTGSTDNTISLFGLTPTVKTMRTLSITGLVLSLVGLVALGLFYFALENGNQVAFIFMKYGPMIVDVYDRGLETLSSAFDVASIDDLARMAERQNSTILHASREDVHYYFVQNGSTTYRFVTHGGKKG